MKKVTELKQNECILCTTEEECNAIMDLMHEAGLKWDSGDSYKKHRPTDNLPNHCYHTFAGTYCHEESAQMRGYTIYPASDFIFAPKRGDTIEVSDDNYYRKKRIFLTEIKGAMEPFICVNDTSKEQYKEGKEFFILSWKYARPLQERKPRAIEATDEERESIQKQLGI